MLDLREDVIRRHLGDHSQLGRFLGIASNHFIRMDANDRLSFLVWETERKMRIESGNRRQLRNRSEGYRSGDKSGLRW